MSLQSTAASERSPALHQDGGVPRVIERDGTRIAYRLLGHGEQTVLFLQPFWTSIEDALDGAQTFILQFARSYRLILHDRRGTGDSSRHPETITTDEMIEDIAAVIADSGVEQVALVGTGESGPLVLRAAASHPGLISRVVLIDPMLRPLRGPGSTMLLHTLHSRPRAGLTALARTLVDDDLKATDLGAMMARTVDGPTAARLYEAFLDADCFAVLDEVSMPVLLAYGVVDRLSSDDEARSLQGALPDARIGIVNGPAGGEATVREAWVQIRDFLAEDGPHAAAAAVFDWTQTSNVDAQSPIADAVPSGSGLDPARTGSGRAMPLDYVPMPAVATPTHVPARVRPLHHGSSTAGPQPVRHTTIAWGPPPGVPEEAVRLNRQGIDQLLIGRIEEALTLFQAAIDLAPEYEDAAVNHRELLSRLVQRRVAEWQARQSEELMAESERRAARHGRRPRRRKSPLGWLLQKSTGTAAP